MSAPPAATIAGIMRRIRSRCCRATTFLLLVLRIGTLSIDVSGAAAEGTSARFIRAPDASGSGPEGEVARAPPQGSGGCISPRPAADVLSYHRPPPTPCHFPTKVGRFATHGSSRQDAE